MRRITWIALALLCLATLATAQLLAEVQYRLTGLTAQLKLVWTDNSTNEDGFKIERKTGTSGTFAQIATVGANVTSYTDASLAAGSTYCYRVRAFNTTGDSAYSDEFCGTASSDTQAPTVSLTAPANSSMVSGSSVTVSASASDNVEVVGVQFLLDGASVGSESTTAPYSIAWDTTTATNGTHSLAAVARDAAGNQTTSATVTITVDNPPSVVITAPALRTIVSPGATARFVVEARDDVAVVEVRGATSGVVTSTEARAISPPAASAAVPFDVTVPASAPQGTLTFAAVATDSRGQTSATSTLTVRVGVCSVNTDCDVANGNTRLTVTIPTGVAAGDLHVVTDSGMSNGFPILGAFGLVGTAAEGVALDPMVPSANPGQMITVTGEALSTSIFVVFSSTDTKDAPVTVETPLTNVNGDGTQASVTVPVTAETGPVRLRPASGEPFPETTLLQIVPTLSSLIVPAGGVLQPGGAATLVGTGFRVGATKVEFSGAAPVAPDSLTRQVLTVTVPAELTAGSARVRTNGGSSCWRSSAG